MKVSTTTLLLAAALGVAAHPSGHSHKHMHRSAVEKRTDFFIAKKPAPPAASPTYVAPPPAAPPATTPSTQPPASSPSGSGSGTGPSLYTPFCGGKSNKRATAAEIAYKGNVGTPGNYGCNLMLIQTSIVNKYDYTVTFSNAGSQDQKCACWNKIGPDNGINGFFNGNQALTFDLPAGSKQAIAADSNTQGGCSCGAGALSLTSFGQFAGSWVEFDFGNQSNGGWSGADASCLVAAKNGLAIPGLNVCSSGTCSTINPGGTGKNAYLSGMEAADGVGLNLPAGKVNLQVTVDYKG
ncbi:Allergen Asp f 4 [Tolypocladium ophioglossoides CBS 100239]|uniref:Allergen Asp f 4 n=1 Tax=Tolypocladium ophioglossoides (strain CBS 100239) TaxID=1163406 RepID=A0A0L0NC53_TOLOC|nr:Allergen Asp f 4 [Tolypocladium ophioglossoides CBS 100239]